MRKILSIDAGTNSLGWVIRDPNKAIKQITHAGVLIFEKGVGEEKNNEFSLAAERRSNRSARRLKKRKRIRKGELLELLMPNMCPLKIEELHIWTKYSKGIKRSFPDNEKFHQWLKMDFNGDGEPDFKTPYHLRKYCVEHIAEPMMVGRALYHLIQRRGYKSNRKDGKGGESETAKKIKETEEWLNGETFGQKAASLIDKGEKVRKAAGEGCDTSRGMFEYEVDKICKKQGLDIEFTNRVKQVILRNRPLKSQKSTVGKCTFETDKPRSPISTLEYEEFRMWEFINKIKCKPKGAAKEHFSFLSKEQKDKIKPQFFRKSKPTFKFADIAKILEKDRPLDFNYSENQTVVGCSVTSRLQAVFGDDLKAIKIPHQAINKKTGEIKDSFLTIEDIWHVLFTFDDDEKLEKYAHEKLKLEGDALKDFLKINLPQGYAKLSRKAINKILPFLREGHIYTVSCFLANIPEVIGEDNWKRDKNKIIDKLDEISSNDRDSRIQTHIINGIIGDYLKNDKKFVGSIREIILQKAMHHYGTESWGEIGAELQNEIFKHIETELNYYVVQNNGERKRFKVLPRIDEAIKGWLKSEYNVSKEHLDRLYHPSDIDTYSEPKRAEDGNKYLGSPKNEGLKNPMAMRTLHILRRLVNHLIEEGWISNDDTVMLETARELNDSNLRKAIQRYQKQREDENEQFKKRIIKDCHIPNPTADDITKYRLWVEQNATCIYTGDRINICDAFGDNPKYDIEHTLPRSKTFDTTLENLTLANKEYNREIKKNRIPTECPNWNNEITFQGKAIQSISSRLEKWEKKVEELKDTLERIKAASATAKGEGDPERHAILVQKKHLARFEFKYWNDKLNRLKTKEIKAGFKNSQLVDTQIITKSARAYLQTVFNKVHVVKSVMTNEIKDVLGVKSRFKAKSRDKHIHHAIDAAVISALTRDEYNRLSEFYRENEKYSIGEGKRPKMTEPWPGFMEEINELRRNVIVKHIYRDNVAKQTIKRLRKGGKIVYSENGARKPKLMKGSGVRGQLHKETFYGAIQVFQRDSNGKVIKDVNGKPLTELKYRVSSPIGNLKESNLKNIVDPRVKEAAIAMGLDAIKKEGSINVPARNGHKGFKVKKVKYFANDVKSPLKLKEIDKVYQSDKEHKKYLYVKNEENYMMVFYEGENRGKTKTDFKVLSLFDIAPLIRVGVDGEFYEKSYIKNEGKPSEVEFKVSQRNDKDVALKKGQMVLFYTNTPEELEELTKTELSKRLYRTIGFENDGRVSFVFHMEARPMKDLGKGESSFDATNPPPKLRLSSGNLNMLIEGIDFDIWPSGVIELNNSIVC